MASVNYYLKGAVSEKNIQKLKQSEKHYLKELLEKPLQIFLKVSMAGERLQIFTKRRIAQKFWNKEKQEVDYRKYRTGVTEINDWLTGLRKSVVKRCLELENNGERITQAELRQILLERSIIKPTGLTIEDYFKRFIKDHKTASGHALMKNTLKKYNSLLNQLINYCASNGVKPVSSNIHYEFIKGFRDYLSIDLGLADNTTTKYLKSLNTFTRYLFKKGIVKPFDISNIKSVETEREVHVLKLNQVLDLQKLEIKKECLARARDVFCFMCWTGQRFSDTERIKWENIIEDENGKYWDLVTQKTNERIKVPLVNHALEILDKYKDYPIPLPIISNQKMNEYLKDLGKEAELNHSEKIIRQYQGRKKELTVPFYDVLTTHVARKSFITNSLILGVPERVVRDVSGHKDERSFRRYIKLADEYKMNAIRDAYDNFDIDKQTESK